MIGGISSYASSSYYSMANLYRAMSSGRRINTAADDAAGLAAARKMNLQSAGYVQQNRNDKDQQNLLNIQDGRLATTTSALERMYELSVQASNGTYGPEEKGALQREIGQLMDFIGSDKLAELGLTGYDVTQNPDLTAISGALQSVSGSRGDIGALSNSLDARMSARAIANENTVATLSDIVDLDYGEMFNRVNTQQTLFQMRLMMQKRQMSEMSGKYMSLLGFQ